MSDLKLEDGFYWVRLTDEHDPLNHESHEVTMVKGGRVYLFGSDLNYHTSHFNFGPDPQPIQKPEWCK